ncbi:MAG TPA: glycoside hydrolase family 130 protein [Lacipirellulaceae bacterium]|nr:glycoside hydrolase family 130 protein [Lacipirellulaceae bacterium]
MDIKRTGLILKPNNARVLFRPFEFSDQQRIMKIMARVMELTDAEVDALVEVVLTEFHGRHYRLQQYFLDRFDALREHLITDRALTEQRRMLIGSYFTQEYALESAALFNPSIVWHPDQTGVDKASKRFILSLRATGEGHISSIAFRSGVVDGAGNITIDKPTGFVTAPSVTPSFQYEKTLFLRKLDELGVANGFVELTFGALDEQFSIEDLETRVRLVLRQHRARQHDWAPLAKAVLALAKANYEIECDPASDVSERIIFPYSPTETNGIEDARFVEFVDDDGARTYYATYTAFDGNVVFPQLVETSDFIRFRISTLNGPEVRNKGLALFPRKIGGNYAMISRQDGENMYLMYSDLIHFWYTKIPLLKPTYPWEFVQVGNCGSPIETEAGWLVLTHGVGPMRKYSIGAILLDRDDPSRVLGRLDQPLLAPDENERAGYVPNVVYSCGAVVHAGRLIIPYAMSDFASTFATVPVAEVIDAMVPGAGAS